MLEARDDMLEPLVSIVTATYNRSNVLRFAVESVLRSTLRDWELIVVGDACTDDTADVVGSFGDARIRFVDLPRNCGEQSGPNNEGLRLARGRYIAFLNHDDLWTPRHLEVCTAGLERLGADLVFSLSLTLDHRGRTRLAGVTGAGDYDRLAFIPASSWVFRRALADRVGPWRPAQTLYLAPSADWLDRAWRTGARLRSVPEVTVVAILSGGRRNAYAERQSAEHERVARALESDPRYIESLATSAALAISREARYGLAAPLVRAAKYASYRILSAAGIHPMSVHHALRYGRRGGFLDRLRRTRGLPPLADLPLREHGR